MTRIVPLCYGKLPIFPEFIRHGMEAATLTPLDQWLQEGMVHAEGRLGSGWREAFDEAAPTRFLARIPGLEAEVAGVISPSRDQAGRQFPFLIFAIVDPAAIQLPSWVMPMHHAEFFSKAEALLARGWDGRDVAAVRSDVDGLAMEAGPVGAREHLDSRLAQETVGSLWPRLFDVPFGLKPHLLLRNFRDLVMQKRPPPYVLRFPRVRGAEDVGFWLVATNRLRAADLPPTFVAWSASGSDASCSLRILLDEPQGKHFLPLLLPEADPGEACVLATEGEGDEQYSEESRLGLDELVAAEEMSLDRLIIELEMTGRA